MKKRLLGISVLSMVLIMTSCASMFEITPTSNHAPIVYEDENVTATLELSPYGKWARLILQNKTGKVLVFVTDYASFTSSSGTNARLVPEETKYIDVGYSQPPVSIPPLSSFTKSFFTADSVYFSPGGLGGWERQKWIVFDMEGSAFVFCYKLDGKDYFITFKGANSSPLVEK